MSEASGVISDSESIDRIVYLEIDSLTKSPGELPSTNPADMPKRMTAKQQEKVHNRTKDSDLDSVDPKTKLHYQLL